MLSLPGISYSLSIPHLEVRFLLDHIRLILKVRRGYPAIGLRASYCMNGAAKSVSSTAVLLAVAFIKVCERATVHSQRVLRAHYGSVLSILL